MKTPAPNEAVLREWRCSTAQTAVRLRRFRSRPSRSDPPPTQSKNTLNVKPPSIENYSKFSHISEANSNTLLDGIHSLEGLCLKIIPKQNIYMGNLFILTNSKTASTCEPIVYGLKQIKRATIVGEKTAGAMLNGEYFELDKGFSMFIPTADYYTSDGFRIEQNGVKPDIVVKREKALDYVIGKLIK